MDKSTKSKRVETREFWEAAIRLWTESGLSVREFCNREGLAEHTFYLWRREVMPPAIRSTRRPCSTTRRITRGTDRPRF